MLADQEKKKTAFSMKLSSFNWCCLAFRPANSPRSFQRFIDIVLRDQNGLQCYIFLHDIILFSDTLEKLAIILEHVVQRSEGAKLLLQILKKAVVFICLIIKVLHNSLNEVDMKSRPLSVTRTSFTPCQRLSVSRVLAHT
jgi:hypothetical protein